MNQQAFKLGNLNLADQPSSFHGVYCVFYVREVMNSMQRPERKLRTAFELHALPSPLIRYHALATMTPCSNHIFSCAIRDKHGLTRSPRPALGIILLTITETDF